MNKKKDFLLPKYFHDQLWNVPLKDRTPLLAFVIKQLRIIYIVSKNYTQDNLQIQSAGLTFYTMLSVVPLVALAFAIAKGFGFERKLEAELTESLRGHEDVVEQIMTFANRMLENTQGGLLAGVGVVILLWTVMRLLINVELSFNEIWKVAKGRTWLRRFSEYFSIMIMAPVIVILAGSITVVISAQMENLVAGYDFLKAVGPVIHFFVQMIPYVLIWLLFTFVYMVMPNTKVKFSSALVAGIIAGTSFQLLEWGYINFQVGVSKYNAIYGSFAALPLFMIWVNTSWLITLIGAEIAFANQNVSEIENEIDGDKLSNEQRHVMALLIMKQVAKHFGNGSDPINAKELTEILGLPYGVTSKVLDIMVEAKLLILIDASNNATPTYLPHHSVEQMRISEVISSIDAVGFADMPALNCEAYTAYFSKYKALRDAVRDNKSNETILSLPNLETKP